MNLIGKLERKLGRYAIRNLMKYILVLYVIGILLGTFNPMIYYEFLSLDISMILKGQIWRLFTFLIPVSDVNNILWVALSMYFYYSIGNALENIWGSFRFNLYLISGVIFYLIGCFIIYFVSGPESIYLIMIYGFQAFDMILGTLFFAFAAVYSESQFLIYFIIPVKAKYLAWLRGALYLVEIFNNIKSKNYGYVLLLILIMTNFIIFFFMNKNHRKFSPSQMRRKVQYKRQMNAGGYGTGKFNGKSNITRHKCAVCGRTEADNEDLEFRFCSRCDGNHEYCMEHLFTHEHVKQKQDEI